MRSEISNELLLQVIQAWDPGEADKLSVSVDLRWNGYFIRESDGHMLQHHESDPWHEASKLVEFLLKDRPDLGLLKGSGGWKDEVPEDECLKATNGCWDSDPWEYSTTPVRDLVIRIKAYEYLREWKERQESTIDPSDVTVTIDGQTIEGIPGEFIEVPATYETICPHCNGTKEVTGWSGKESCNAC